MAGGWLLGALVLIPLSLVMPLGISEFAGASNWSRGSSVLVGWTIGCFFLTRSLESERGTEDDSSHQR